MKWRGRPGDERLELGEKTRYPVCNQDASAEQPEVFRMCGDDLCHHIHWS